MTDIAERLRAVETRLETIETVQNDMASDVRAVRDYMIEQAGIRKAFKYVFSIAAGVIATIGAAWGLYKGRAPVLFG